MNSSYRHHRRLPFDRRRCVAVLTAGVLVFAACGSSDESAPGTEVLVVAPGATDDVGRGDEPATTDGDEETRTEPEPPTTAGDPPTSTEVDPPVTNAVQPPTTDGSAQECVDDPFCEEPPVDSSPREPDVLPEFVPAPEDQAFCTTYEELDERAQPVDDNDAVGALELFRELAPVVPDEIRADFDLLESFLVDAVQSQFDIDLVELDPELEAAAERLGDFVEARCEGRGSFTPPPPPPDTSNEDDPPLPDGVVIPYIEVVGDARDEPQPYFGDDDGALAGFQPAAGDAGFCTAIDIINSRPQSEEEFEEILAAHRYFVSVAPLVPQELEASWTTIVTWVEMLVAAGSFDAIEEPDDGDDISIAVDTVDGFVHERCQGR